MNFRENRGPELRRAIDKAMTAATAGDNARAARAVRIIAQGGPDNITTAVSAWYTPVITAVGTPGGTFAMKVYDTDGRQMGVDGTGITPGQRDALRLLTCRGNHDHETMHAIVLATWNTGLFAVAELMVASLQLAATLSRTVDQGARD